MRQYTKDGLQRVPDFFPFGSHHQYFTVDDRMLAVASVRVGGWGGGGHDDPRDMRSDLHSIPGR